MNYRATLYTLGQISLISGVLLLIPLFMAIGYGESGTPLAFGVTVGVCAALGILGIFAKPKNLAMRPSAGFVVCGLAWILMSIIGSMPYAISGVIPSYIDALFETVSGFTTTGATILPEVESLPASILFWRSLTQWIGGMGVLIFVIAILPKNDQSSIHLAKAETTGAQFGKLVSKLRFTARILYAIYIVLTLINFAVLCLCKMPAFDSICHALTTASTGGFSVKNAGLIYYDSVSIDIVTTVFMMIFSINFNIFFMILIGRFLKAIKNEEMIAMFGIYFCAVVAITVALAANNTYDSIGTAIRHSAFQASSIMSTTGFASADFTIWPTFAQTILLVLMFIGGSASSTAGGFKVSRVIILTKTSFMGIKKTASPRSVATVKMDGKSVPSEIVTNVLVFFVIYIAIILVSMLALSFDNFDNNNQGFITNFSAVITCLSNVGPGLGLVGPLSNFGGYSVFGKIVLIIDMLAGRLELMPILLLLYPKAWKRM